MPKKLEQLLFPFVLLAVTNGARSGELLGLSWDCVDLDKEMIHLKDTKNGRPSILAVVGKGLEILRNLFKTRNPEKPLVFAGKNGKILAMSSMKEPPVIRTNRLILRQWRPADIERLVKLNADPRVMEYFLASLTLDESIARFQLYTNYNPRSWMGFMGRLGAGRFRLCWLELKFNLLGLGEY